MSAIDFLDATFKTVRIIKENAHGCVSLIRRRTDGSYFICRECSLSRKTVYERLKEQRIHGVPHILYLLTEAKHLIVIEEFIEGHSLENCLREKSLPAGISLRQICGNALRILERVHDANILHRDIKPEHLILTPSGEVFLIDFGIARFLGGAADTEIQGTRAYAPPEQFGFQVTDIRSDLYALGRTMEECSAVLPADWRLRRVLHRATAFDPSKRYPSARAMRHALSLPLPVGSKTLFIAGIFLLLGLALSFSTLFPTHALFPQETTQEQEAESEENEEDDTTADRSTAKQKDAKLKLSKKPVSKSAQKKAEDASSVNSSSSEADSSIPPNALEIALGDVAPILSTPSGGVGSVSLAEGDSAEFEVSLDGARTHIAAENDGTGLSLSLTSANGQSTSYRFNYEEPSIHNYPTADHLDAEIAFTDIDGDGRTDIVPALAKRLTSGSSNLPDYNYAWAICQTDGGFSAASGRAGGDHLSLYPGFLLNSNMTMYSVQGEMLSSRPY